MPFFFFWRGKACSKEEGQCPGTSLPGLWAVWKAPMLCPGLKARWADRREAFPTNRDSFQQPAYSVALEMPLISSSCAPTQPWEFGESGVGVCMVNFMGRKHLKDDRKFILRLPNKGIAVLECHQSLPPSSPLLST